MSKLPRWTTAEAERAFLNAGFDHLRPKGSHRICGKRSLRVTVSFHGNAILHPKIIKQVVEIIEEAIQDTHSES